MLFIRHHLGSAFTRTDRKGSNYRQECAAITEISQVLYSCNSWLISVIAFNDHYKVGECAMARLRNYRLELPSPKHQMGKKK